jgi:signal transduction histidine kinase
VQSLSLAKEQSDRDRAHAAAAGRAKSQFLSNMNHELRTPMNAILGFSELIETKAFGTDIDKYVEYAGIIHGSGQHLLTLINDMLDLAKIEGGRLSLREDEMNIVYLLGDVVEANQTNAAKRQINLVRELDAGLPPLFADERALRQIALNLVSNALKFTQPGGTVTIFARTDNRSRILFGVRDTGIGIAPEDHEQVFERFGRGRHDITIADQGTGLGLAIVKGFAEAHDGQVRLESALGIGTTLTVILPAERARPAGYTMAKTAS